ncbi:MAG: hypothetical protein GX421_10745 [Caldisericales bacterium]|nr:hypothetical protein [Caldisericales bacterium]
MEQNKTFLIKQFKRLYKIEYFSKMVKLIPLLLFVVLSPILVYDEFISGKYLTAIFISIAELLFLFLSYTTFLSIKGKTSFSKSRINKCFQNQNILNKIIVSDNKILFDISDMEDEAIYLKSSEYKKVIVNSLKSVFGESKIVSNV